MAEDSATPIDDESIQFLQDAKKGKPRQFVMICKGVRILKLTVFKTGKASSQVLAAKKEGFSGQPYWGVVTGEGQSLTFQLAASDGFDKPPGKELILKDFLKSNADFRCDPEYVVVEKLPSVEEDESGEGSGQEEQPSVASPKPDLDASLQRDKIAEAFGKLSPKIPAFVRDFPDRRVEILKPAKRVKDFLDDADSTEFGPALDAIKTIHRLIGESAGPTGGVSSEPQSSSSTTSDGPPGDTPSDESDTTTERPTDTETTKPLDPDFSRRVKEAGEKAKKLAAPPEVLELVRQSIGHLKAGRTTELEETLGTLEPRLTTLERTRQAEQEILQATGRGNVRYRVLKTDWIQSRARAEGELSRMIDEIAFHPEVVFDKRRDEIQQVARGLADEFPRFDKRLESLLDEADKADDATRRTELRRDALGVIEEYVSDIERRPKLQLLDDSFFGKASIYGELHKTLIGLREVLSSQA